MNYDDWLLQNSVTQLQQTPVAIIGMACIFPQASSLQAYWQNIIGKVDCITEVPPERWKIDEYYNPDPASPDKTYCKRGGFIPEIDFNPMEFGLPPNILEVTDVAQLLALVVARQAMKDASYDLPSEAIQQRTGVVLGVGGGQKLITPLTSRLQYPIWEKVLKNSGLSDEDTQKMIEKIKLAYIGWEENSFPGMLGNVIAGRIANRLDLGSMNCVVDAACASSLTAVRMGLSELTERRSDMMIVGGVDADNSIFMYMSFSKTPALSKQGQPRPFDAQSDGMMLGEGIGMMVLKRLEDAQADGDRIYATIKGIGTSSDGKYKSIYAPRSSGQALALRRAYEDAGFSPATVGLIEAHGTGTKAGDPTEFAALKEVFSQDNPRKEYIALGSVKSQIGHTKPTAGAASMIKTALALYHKVLPPTINITKPNPKLEGDKPHLAVALNASRQQSSDLQLQQAVMQLRVAGLPLGNMDPYFLEPQASTSLPKKGLTVRLNGSNYVSEKTKAVFEKALRDGHKVSLPLNTESVGYKKQEVVPEPEISQMSKSFHSSQSAAFPGGSQGTRSGHKTNSVAPELEMLDMSKLSQSPQSAAFPGGSQGTRSGHKIEEVAPEPEILDMSKLFQSPQSAAFPGGSQGTRSLAIDGWERIIMRFQEHQGEVLGVHEQYLKDQAQYAQGFFQLMQQQYSQLTANGAIAGSAVPDRIVAPTVAPAPPVVAKTTPIPNMDGEPSVASAPPVEGTSTAIPKMDGEASVSSAPPVVEKTTTPKMDGEASVSSAPPVVEKTTATPKMDLEPLKKAMLEVVSEKTGYPASMLELEMDMEADLGIDSIKRVEIMGSMQELFPDMPPVNPEELAELRTLGEVVEYMGQQTSSTAATPAAPAISSQSGSALETEQLVDLEPLKKAMLEVVSEKTGYPASMLELEMDMEADLGIDSIKRVEIMGSMQELFPEMPPINPEELAELRTLGEVVEYMGPLVAEKKI